MPRTLEGEDRPEADSRQRVGDRSHLKKRINLDCSRVTDALLIVANVKFLPFKKSRRDNVSVEDPPFESIYGL